LEARSPLFSFLPSQLRAPQSDELHQHQQQQNNNQQSTINKDVVHKDVVHKQGRMLQTSFFFRLHYFGLRNALFASVPCPRLVHFTPSGPTIFVSNLLDILKISLKLSERNKSDAKLQAKARRALTIAREMICLTCRGS
jgi:hypothetical protein